VIERQAVSRYVDVTANVPGDLGSAVKAANAALKKVSFPPETHAEVLAAAGQPQGRLISVAIAAAIGIFLLLQAVFGSWRLAALCFTTLPLAVVGGLLAALADGRTLSFGSYLGLLAVLGLAARNGVLLIRRYRHLEQEERRPFDAQLVLRGAGERVSPTVLAAAAAALVLSPVAVAGSITGYEVIHPLAVVVLGGLVTSTFVNLFVTPLLYLKFSAVTEPVTEMTPAEALRRRLRIWAGKGEAPEVPVRSELP
jgi:Cu/Ag efflux pump CusA